MSTTQMTDTLNCHLAPAAKGLWAVVIIMLVLTTSLVLMRLYARLIRVKAFGWDDAMLLIAYALNIAHIGLEINNLTHGFGRHVECVTHARFTRIKEWITIAQFIGIYSELFSRLSTAILIIRLFGVSKLIRYVMIGYAVVQCLVLGITGILVWFQCSPPRSLWDSQIPHTCWSAAGREALADTNAVFSILGDFVAVVIPLYFLCNLHMPKRLKLVVMSMFTLSLTPSACAIARMILHYTLTSRDFTYQEPSLDVVFTLEISMLVVCASLPTVPGLFREKPRSQGTSGYHKPLMTGTSHQSYPWTSNSSPTSARFPATDNQSFDNNSQNRNSGECGPNTKATLTWTPDGFAVQ